MADRWSGLRHQHKGRVEVIRTAGVRHLADEHEVSTLFRRPADRVGHGIDDGAGRGKDQLFNESQHLIRIGHRVVEADLAIADLCRDVSAEVDHRRNVHNEVDVHVARANRVARVDALDRQEYRLIRRDEVAPHEATLRRPLDGLVIVEDDALTQVAVRIGAAEATDADAVGTAQVDRRVRRRRDALRRIVEVDRDAERLIAVVAARVGATNRDVVHATLPRREAPLTLLDRALTRDNLTGYFLPIRVLAANRQAERGSAGIGRCSYPAPRCRPAARSRRT